VAFVPGVNANPSDVRSIWRDVKVANNAAYIGSEVNGHGMQVFDLTRLRKLLFPPRKETVILQADAVMTEFGASHNIVAFPERGVVMGVGLSQNGFECGRNTSLAIYDVSENPAAPVFQECFVSAEIEYVHDAHCIVYNGPDTRFTGQNICALFAADQIYIIDFDTKAIINNFVYENFGYVHQGWFSEDHAYLYADDEVDEIDLRNEDTTTFLIDLRDLTDSTPTIETFVHNRDTDFIHDNIDHNLYVKDGHIYQVRARYGSRFSLSLYFASNI